MNIEKELHRLNIENIIWIIYFFIILFSIYSNYLDKKYLLQKNKKAKIKEKNINIIISLIVFFIYIYFLKISYEDYKDVKIKSWNNKTYKNNFISLIGSLLFLIAGSLEIYTSLNITDPDEIGFI